MFGTPTTSAPIATDTILPKFPYYFRINGETQAPEINRRISSKVTEDSWIPIPNRVNSGLNSDSGTWELGEFVLAYVREAEAADAWMQRHDTLMQQAHAAIAMIGERLIDESERRGWCSEFDQIVDEVNANLPGPFALPVRQRDYVVSWTETYTITVQRSTTVTARNEDDACQLVDDEIGDANEYDIRDAISYGNYEFSDDNGDFEAEEA